MKKCSSVEVGMDWIIDNSKIETSSSSHLTVHHIFLEGKILPANSHRSEDNEACYKQFQPIQG